MKICKQPPKRYNVSSLGSGGGGSGSGSGSSHVTISIPLIQSAENSDAERRRLKALKALKERLKKPDEEDGMGTQWSDATSTTNLIESSGAASAGGGTASAAVSQISEKNSTEQSNSGEKNNEGQ